MKEFFKKPIALFVGIAVALNLGSLALVFTGSIAFETFLASIVPISMSVFGMYQYMIKNAVIKEANVILNQAQLIQQELVKTQDENVNLKEKVTLLNDVMKTNEVSDTIDIKNEEEVEAKVVKPKAKRKYTKRNTKK